jgi:hypothetical protein
MAATTTTFRQSAWACEPPAKPPPLITFEGVALSSQGDLANPWAFRVDPPVEGLPETVEVFIERSDAGDGASCQIAGPELVVGATYEIVAGQWPGNDYLNVSLYVGSYRLLAEAPVTTAAPSVAPAEVSVAEALASNTDASKGWSTRALMLIAAIAGLVAVMACAAFARSRTA